ncbi:MAG: ATP-dependent zinc protease [Pseudomonadales bacterium]
MQQIRRPAPVALAAPWLIAALLLSGCKQVEVVDETQITLNAMQAQLDEVERQIEASRQALDQLEAADVNRTEYLDTRLATIGERLEALPGEIHVSCPEPKPVKTECKEVARVVVTSDKMLVGELERIWIEPPGVSVVARMDTGATSSSVHANNLERFERDGEDWVRFDLPIGPDESVTLERPIVRHARVRQQADPEGSRRPVVQLRIRLGEIQDTFEFTLADRSHLENEWILGRNFLTDVTLVDVSRQFVQPRYIPPKNQ